MFSGTIKNLLKRYGFITLENGEGDIFFHEAPSILISVLLRSARIKRIK